MSNKLQTSQRKTMTEYFQEQVGRAVASMPDLISSSEANRLTLNLLVAAQNSIEKDGNKFKWTNSNISDFLSQLIMHVTAGLDAANNEVYAYPYKNKMAVMPSYKGYRKMVKEHAVGTPVTDILCFVVREGEKFRVHYGRNDDEWDYESITFNTAPVVGYVTVALYEDGSSRVMEHTLEDIEKRMKANPGGTSPAWKNWPIEMAKAKAIKRHAKTIDIRLRPEVEGAARSIDEDDFESFKDVTPPTIMLPEGIGEEEVEEEEPVPEPEPVPVVTKRQKAKAQPRKITPEPTPEPPVFDEYSQIPLDWMEA
jgi:recombinational DNA repair protein RecT